MILEEHSLIVSKELDFSFEEMISLEIALINKGRLLPSHKLDYDQERNIRVYYGSQQTFFHDTYSQEEEEEIIENFLKDYEYSDDDCQSLQSIPQNLMDKEFDVLSSWYNDAREALVVPAAGLELDQVRSGRYNGPKNLGASLAVV